MLTGGWGLLASLNTHVWFVDMPPRVTRTNNDVRLVQFCDFSFSGLSFSALHHIPRKRFSGISNKTIEVFRLKPYEVKRAKELEKLLQPLGS